MDIFSHLRDDGQAHMVNVGAKPLQKRRAVAEGALICSEETIEKLRAHALPKGDVLTVAQIAGIQAAKRTAELIPLCHPLPIDAVSVEFTPDETGIGIAATVRTSGRTGVEMEALTAVSVAALTVYDMVKAVDRGMRIEAIRVVQKSGGASGDFTQA
jgi:cyclic pyranopterin phosphate synthase